MRDRKASSIRMFDVLFRRPPLLFEVSLAELKRPDLEWRRQAIIPAIEEAIDRTDCKELCNLLIVKMLAQGSEVPVFDGIRHEPSRAAEIKCSAFLGTEQRASLVLPDGFDL